MKEEKEVKEALLKLEAKREQAKAQRLVAQGLDDFAGVLEAAQREALAEGGIVALQWVLVDTGPRIITTRQ